MLASLNSSQRHAVELSLAQRLLCIQGPPGTGKTQVADALIQVWSSQRSDGPVVAAAPSNVGADNLARRLLGTTSLRVKRIGPVAKIHVDLHNISSRAQALAADWDPKSMTRKANRRRKQWENHRFHHESDVVLGTLEMSADLSRKDAPWESGLILVDEAGQATEPMTIIPL